jgi:hypothetical protein
MWKYFLFTALGMFLMFIVLKILASKSVQGSSQMTANAVRVIKSSQFSNLLKTNEAKELIKTPEFKNFISTLADEEIKAFSASLVSFGQKV